MVGFTTNFFILRLLLSESCCALRFEIGEVTAVRGECAETDMQDAVDDGIEKVPIMRHQQQCAWITLQPAFEPQHSIEIEVVCGFVEKQDVRGTHERLGEIGSHAQSAGKFLDRLIDTFGIETEPIEQGGGSTPRCIAAELIEIRQSLGMLNAILATFRFGENLLAAAQGNVAIDDVLDDGSIRVG